MARGYSTKKNEEDVKVLFEHLRNYRSALKRIGIKDKQVKQFKQNKIKDSLSLLYHFVLLAFYSVFSAPGIVLSLPITLFVRFLAEKERKKVNPKTTLL